MSRDHNGTSDFERQLHALLEESVQRVGGHARSRLNQARHAALTEAGLHRGWSLSARAAAWIRRPLLWMPASGAVAAALLVSFVLWPHAPQGYPAAEVNHTTVEDLDLLADRDGMDLMQGGDGQFYEWAIAQSQAGPGQGQGGHEQGSADPNSG